MVKKPASRISALLDITLNDDDSLLNLIYAKCKRRVESLENHTEVAEGHEKSLAEDPNFHYRPLYYSDKFTIGVQTLTSHDTEESENSLESPHLGENSVYQTLFRFLC